MERTDISSKAPYPICELSNFAFHPFEMDGVRINSIEGFLQALKFRSDKKQKQICLLYGKQAKKAGKINLYWRILKRLYWQGRPINRFSPQYSELITRAYDNMAANNSDFIHQLLSLKGFQLEHSVGKDDKKQTVLTKNEFLNQLYRLQCKYSEKK